MSKEIIKRIDDVISRITCNVPYKKGDKDTILAALELSKEQVGEGELLPNIIGSFTSKQNWINRATRELAYFRHEDMGHKIDAICVDSIGRRCICGYDFMRAEKEETYPIYYFVDCKPRAGLNKFLESIGDD